MVVEAEDAVVGVEAVEVVDAVVGLVEEVVDVVVDLVEEEEAEVVDVVDLVEGHLVEEGVGVDFDYIKSSDSKLYIAYFIFLFSPFLSPDFNSS